MTIGFRTQHARHGAEITPGRGAWNRSLACKAQACVGTALALLATPAFSQTAPDLGSTSPYAIVSGTFSNTTAGTSADGDVCFTIGPAVNPAVTGAVQTPCPPQTGTDQLAARAELDAQSCTSIGAAVALDTIIIDGRPPGEFPPGCYSTTGAMSISTDATVTLTGDGVHIFRSGGALGPAAGSTVVTTGGACADSVFWTPEGGTTIGANATFVGTVFRGLAEGLSITLGDSASLEGRALAFGSTVTTANSTIAVPAACPESGTITILKQASPTDTGESFDFSGDLGNFSLMHGETLVETRPPGVYTVNELVPAGWQLDSASCDDGSAVGSIDLEAGQAVTCTFVNVRDNGPPVVEPPVGTDPVNIPTLPQPAFFLIVFTMMATAAAFLRRRKPRLTPRSRMRKM